MAEDTRATPTQKQRFDNLLMSNPEFVKYLNQGRAELGTISQGMKTDSDFQAYLKAELKRLQAEDKTVANYYEIATGQKPTQEVIDSFAQYASDPALLQAAIAKSAVAIAPTGQFIDAIKSTVTDKLGRDATEAELEFFGKQMEQGNLDAYGLQQFLEGTNEYQTKASDVARGKLTEELGAVDTDYLAKVQKSLEAKYAAAGRGGSSAFGSALIGAGKDLATQRTGYLAGLGYEDFQRGQGNLRADYENRLAQIYNQQMTTAGLGSESRQRYYSQQDFNRQQAAQERLAALSQPKTSSSFLKNLVPGLITSGAQIFGAYAGRPQQTSINYGQQGWPGIPYR